MRQIEQAYENMGLKVAGEKRSAKAKIEFPTKPLKQMEQYKPFQNTYFFSSKSPDYFEKSIIEYLTERDIPF